MPNININELRSDVLDRMDNAVVLEQMPEKLRIKLKSKIRVTRAMNQGILLFCRDADPSTIDQLVSVVSPTADTDIGALGDGVAAGMKTHNWPDEAFGERPDGGVIKLIINEKEHNLQAESRVGVETLRYMGESAFYEDDHDSFAIDYDNKRIYTLPAAALKARVVQTPEAVDKDDTYGVADDAVIPVSDTFFQSISQICFKELIKMGENFANRERVLGDTADGMRQQQPNNSEQ